MNRINPVNNKAEEINILCQKCIMLCKQSKYITIIRCPFYKPFKDTINVAISREN